MADPKPGPRDALIDGVTRLSLASADIDQLVDEPLQQAEAPERLARAVAEAVRLTLDPEEASEEQVAIANRVLQALGEAATDRMIETPPRVLKGVRGRTPLGALKDLPTLPATPFGQSDLLVNGDGQPNIGSELKAELESAESVDLICAFVIWSGVRHLRDSLEAVIKRGGRVRVITTTYMGATEKRAVDELVNLGAEVKVALDARTTKLHAKAWLLERESGLTTAFVGSSNLSHTALFDGLEWNVRLSSIDAAHLINRVRTTFESHWESEHFEPYDPRTGGEALTRALSEHSKRSSGETRGLSFAGLDVRPYPHQQRMLDELTTCRERRDEHRNLVVAATGTGKTVVAALDYRQLVQKSRTRPSLLFVAHRDEILKQARDTYCAVLRDGSFGEIHGGGRKATGDHVFAMIQSLSEPTSIRPDQFDVVVVDEFHHAAAPTYRALLEHLAPRELLGLTATPERLDGQDITEWFGGRVAVELRLWEAIDQGFLVPFQYFGVADGTDLTALSWKRGGYVTSELDNLLTNNDARVTKLLEALRKIVSDVSEMRALGFCVSKDHARFMARKFSEAGLPSVALTGDDHPDERGAALRSLNEGSTNCIFSVDVLGEGVDVPNVDCVMLLRPTQSPTVFAQQLGRGLRRANRKSCLTVIDLIGQHRREFRFDNRFRALLDGRGGSVREQVSAGFPFLPAGCTIDLDRQSEEIVLANLKAAASISQWSNLVNLAEDMPAGTTLSEFLSAYDLDRLSVYRQRRSWTNLKREANRPTQAPADAAVEEAALRQMSQLTHIDDPERVQTYRRWFASESAPVFADCDERSRRLLTMLAWGLNSGKSGCESVDEFMRSVWRQEAVLRELDELLEASDAAATTTPVALKDPDIPLAVHARYSRQEVIAALGYGGGVKPKVTQGGILWVPQAAADVFFIDLHKVEKRYSPTTMYRDYAISRELFHWESQNRQTEKQATVQRYINHASAGTNILLFARQEKTFELGTQAFSFLGPGTYVQHSGERPVSFTWRLKHPLPEEIFEIARSVAAA